MLTEDLKVLLASVNSLSIKAQNFHWNVEGDNFPQYHEFFGNFYEEVYSSVDKIAEYIRTLDSYSPGSLTRYAELTIIQDQLKIPRAELMFAELFEDDSTILGQAALRDVEVAHDLEAGDERTADLGGQA